MSLIANGRLTDFACFLILAAGVVLFLSLVVIEYGRGEIYTLREVLERKRAGYRILQ